MIPENRVCIFPGDLYSLIRITAVLLRYVPGIFPRHLIRRSLMPQKRCQFFPGHPNLLLPGNRRKDGSAVFYHIDGSPYGSRSRKAHETYPHRPSPSVPFHPHTRSRLSFLHLAKVLYPMVCQNKEKNDSICRRNHSSNTAR